MIALTMGLEGWFDGGDILLALLLAKENLVRI
jgi:hypothetical protein